MTRAAAAVVLAGIALACTESSTPSATPAAAPVIGDDAAYCAKLADLAVHYTGRAGLDGRLAPTVTTRTAIEECNRGNTAAGIPVLEKLLRSNGFTLPKP
jgi:hypothetical protein